MGRPKEAPKNCEAILKGNEHSFVVLRFHDGDNGFTLTIFKDGSIALAESIAHAKDIKRPRRPGENGNGGKYTEDKTVQVVDYDDRTYVSDGKIPVRNIIGELTALFRE